MKRDDQPREISAATFVMWMFGILISRILSLSVLKERSVPHV
jgi:hypothetical protein